MESTDIGSYSGLTRKQVIWTIAGLQITLLLAALDQTIVSTAMPRIIAELNGFERYAWVTTAYLLTSTATLPVFGRLSDMYGRKWLLLFGAVLFVMASALCGASGHLPMPGDGMTQLIICRGLQGIASGAIMSLVFAALGDLFSPAERGKYQGLFSAVWAFASVLGPVVGGGLTDHFSWRWVFYVNLPIGVVATALLYFAFPSRIREQENESAAKKPAPILDYFGVLTLIGWVVPLLLGLTWAPEFGLHATKVWGTFALSAAMFVAFILIELKHPQPIVPLNLFSNNVIAISCFSSMLVGISMFGIILFLPLYFQAVQGDSASVSGYRMLPMMLMITITSMLAGQMMARSGKYRWIALLGLGVLTTGLFLISRLVVTTPPMMAIGFMTLGGTGLGFLMPVYTIAGQNAAEPRTIGVVTGVIQFFRSIGGTLGAAVFNTILLSCYSDYLVNHIPQETPDEVQALLANPLKLHVNSPSGIPGVPMDEVAKIIPVVKEALVLSLSNIFVDAAALMFIAFIVNLYWKDIPLRKHHAPAPVAPGNTEVLH